MIGMDVVVAGCGLVLAVAVGLVAHEWSHAVVLRLAGIEYTISFAPGHAGGVGGLLASYPWAVVRPYPTGEESPWVLRVGALAPFVLAVPVWWGIGVGVVTTDAPLTMAIAIGWLACSIPSPQDFSVAFYADRQLTE
ncbi:hypothetical protein D8Y22_03080 [Salinadaptatus halalkaliphilus]|uniref:DUF3267 domain-containing protein n=1 Tax=Salinadaptatus halalkaliphilus TaxID=2419781 RepID=A0A4S3TPL5_9EURY|nr:hypothetical protein [Salinadaptatus halalkaliphilus]THE66272.1 hypothetical protein D8Y22_03080 [Salinadaptatus halalkaliphilus]